MPNPVSLLVWRDAKTDPPTGGWERSVFVLRRDGPRGEPSQSLWHAEAVVQDRGRVALWWAELPVVSDLTDDDVRNVALWALDGEVLATGTHNAADRLRAALGGEKEEA